MFTDVGGNGDNFSGTTLDDEAGTAITAGSAPFTGSFRPEGSLSDFDGIDAGADGGNWTLEITDDKRRTEGTLNSWSIEITDTTTTIAVGNAEVIEGDTGTTTDLIFTVTRLGDTTGATTVNWATSDGTATTADNDYLFASGQVSFAGGDPGDTQKTITVTVKGDTVEEAHETFSVTLSGAVGATVVDGTGTGTILNDDTSISIDNVSVTEGDETIRFIDAFITAGSGALSAPRGMTVGPDGHLYVVSSGNDTIVRYDGSTGEFIDVFVASGSGGLDFPREAVFGPDGNLYVTSSNTHSVLRYDGTTGAFVGEFVVSGTGNLQKPRGLLFHDGSLYVTSVDSDDATQGTGDAVLRYDALMGVFLGTFVAPGSGGLNNPTRMAFGPDSNFYVTSTHSGSNSILRYDSAGNFENAFIPSGSGGLDGPVDLMFAGDGFLYVTSWRNDQVLRYNSDTGAFVDAVVPSGTGGLDVPIDLLFDADGNLLVTSWNTDEVLRYGVASQAVFTVSLSSPSGEKVTVDFSTADGSAKDGVGEIEQDYTAASGTVVFDPGVTQRTILVSTIDDAEIKSDETFVVNLFNPSAGATFPDNQTDIQGEATIIDDEAAGPTITNVSPSFASPNEQKTVTVTGTGFANGATADFGTRVNVQSVTFVSSTQLTVQIKVHRRADGGLRDVTITNPDNSTVTCTGCFNVGSSPANATSTQSIVPAQSSNLSDGDETSTETSTNEPTDPTLLNVELAWAEEESDDESAIEDNTEIIATTDQSDLNSLFGDIDGSLQEDLLTV